MAPEDWLAAIEHLMGRGWSAPEFLTAVDWPARGLIEVVVGLRNPDPAAQPPVQLLSCELDREDARLPSATPLCPGFEWAEREAREMFGVEFPGHPYPAPLLLDPDVASRMAAAGQWPMRRTTPLRRRLEQPWPGAADPSLRPAGQAPQRPKRAPAVPGNLPDWGQS